MLSFQNIRWSLVVTIVFALTACSHNKNSFSECSINFSEPEASLYQNIAQCPKPGPRVIHIYYALNVAERNTDEYRLNTPKNNGSYFEHETNEPLAQVTKEMLVDLKIDKFISDDDRSVIRNDSNRLLSVATASHWLDIYRTDIDEYFLTILPLSSKNSKLLDSWTTNTVRIKNLDDMTFLAFLIDAKTFIEQP